MRLLGLVTAASLFSSPCATRATSAHHTGESDDPRASSKFPNLVKWFRNHGGTIDDRVTNGYEPGSNIRGMIATDDIPAETILVHTPGSLVIPGNHDCCGCKNIEAVKEELRKGEQSKWHTYFDFVDISSWSRVPFDWDRARGSGRAIQELQGMPPAGHTHEQIDKYQEECLAGKEMTDLDLKAFKVGMTRVADIGMVPMYDLMNHHNGIINTYLHTEDDGGLFVLSLTGIPAGAPLYLSYARSGHESTIDSFNAYGFVEDYPQLWRWNDSKNQLVENHAHHRYVTESEDLPDPNSSSHEVLVISPTLAALSPSTDLTWVLGNEQLSLEQWQNQIESHHLHLRTSYVNTIRDSATTFLEKLPTTLEFDERLIPNEKRRLEELKIMGKDHANEEDAVQAIEYRIAFKKALQLAIDVAEREKFFDDTDEL
ncbi:hypothetical protein ACHAW5_004794 [Stephanodiscus triporus]|uniref:SET domain-containing protein n=1 Tax=Stephanodiscus triporus TaxID=2934178 RepID=A0ABD3MKC7_9STRA